LAEYQTITVFTHGAYIRFTESRLAATKRTASFTYTNKLRSRRSQDRSYPTFTAKRLPDTILGLKTSPVLSRASPEHDIDDLSTPPKSTYMSMATSDPSPAFQFLVSERIPPELVLKTIQHLPFENGKRIASLSVIPRLKELISVYEHSITNWFMKKELRHALVDFPYCEKFGLGWLSACVSRYDTIDAVMDELTWRENCVAVEAHNVSAVNAGLLVLYRIASIRKFIRLLYSPLFYQCICSALYNSVQTLTISQPATPQNST
jgi:hypothetical protein